MVPQRQLISFILGKELTLLGTRNFKHGHMWMLEKIRKGQEACSKCAKLSSTRYGFVWVTIRDEDIRDQLIWLRIKKHRYFCKSCRKPFTKPTAGVFPRRRTTQRFRKRILKDCD